MSSYRCLKNQCFTEGKFSIVPIRHQDRYAIMKWRNEQMYHLRQNKLLTEQLQDQYFDDVVSKLFGQHNPTQILFSFLKDDKCIGYGGLVHINWIDKNAEISFIIDTSLEKEYFESNWITFLSLIEKVAFEELNLHKIFTYAFDLRPRLYKALEKAGFFLDAELKDHCFFEDNFIDVKLHAKFNKDKQIRHVQIKDLSLTYDWANDQNIRRFSFNKDRITLREHANWFFRTLEDSNKEYYILEVNGKEAGSIRFDIETNEIAKINYLLDSGFTGRGLGSYLLGNGLKFLKVNRPTIRIAYGYVLKENIASVRIFEKLSFQNISINSSELKFEKFI